MRPSPATGPSSPPRARTSRRCAGCSATRPGCPLSAERSRPRRSRGGRCRSRRWRPRPGSGSREATTATTPSPTAGWWARSSTARTGTTCGQAFAEEVARPLGLDLHIGLPPAEHHRVAPLIPAAVPGTPDELTARLLDPESIAHWAFLIPSGLFAIMNDPVILAAELPAANGMGTAHALARMYAAVTGTVDGVRLLGPRRRRPGQRRAVPGIDRVAGYETAYALGFQLVPFRPMAGPGSSGTTASAGRSASPTPAMGSRSATRSTRWARPHRPTADRCPRRRRRPLLLGVATGAARAVSRSSGRGSAAARTARPGPA